MLQNLLNTYLVIIPNPKNSNDNIALKLLPPGVLELLGSLSKFFALIVFCDE